jgi:hypothetical protein
MVDQPLALVAALRSLLGAWQPAVSRPDPPAASAGDPGVRESG